MRKLVMVGVCMLLLVGTTSGATAGGSTSVSGDCLHTSIRPSSIILACADANWYVKRLRWRSWDVDRAAGSGVFHFNDCVPNCSAGTFHIRHGRIALTGRRWCRQAHVWVFTRAAIVYDRAWQGHVHLTAWLACPIS
jgi:hypothetical protein